MTNRAIRVLLTALLAAAFAITAGAQQLNPTVTILKTPTAAVPSDCDQALAPQAAPRVEVVQIPEPPPRKPMAAPPTASVRAQLKDVQGAADRGDRDGFRDSLARVKETLATYPPGGEKSAAGDVIRVYDDLDRVWTYQLDSPTGAFFDSTSSPAQVMRGYPGFDRAMADQVLVGANGTKFYPTTETREFLLREAAARLKVLGVNVATRAPRAPRVIPHIAPAKTRAPEATTAEKTSEGRAASGERGKTTTSGQRAAGSVQGKTAGVHRPAKQHARTKVAEAHEKPAGKRVTAAKTETAVPESTRTSKPDAKHEAKPAKAASEPAKPLGGSVEKTATKPEAKPVAESAAPAAASTAPPAAGSTTPVTTSSAPATSTTAPPSTSAAPAPTETTASTASTGTTATTSAPATETTASAASTDTTGTAAKGQPQGKGVILPIILIVVGIGVLILLFRASS